MSRIEEAMRQAGRKTPPAPSGGYRPQPGRLSGLLDGERRGAGRGASGSGHHSGRHNPDQRRSVAAGAELQSD